jgi:hypothetical protein
MLLKRKDEHTFVCLHHLIYCNIQQEHIWKQCLWLLEEESKVSGSSLTVLENLEDENLKIPDLTFHKMMNETFDPTLKLCLSLFLLKRHQKLAFK